MAYRIAVTSKIPDARTQSHLHALQTIAPKSGLKAASVVQVYTVDAKLSHSELEKAAERLTNPITETYSAAHIPTPGSYTYAIEIGYLPGVTDNVGKTAQETIEDCIGRKFPEGERVYSSVILFLEGNITESEATAFARELHNPLIERATVFKVGQKIPIVVPKVRLHERAKAGEVNLNVNNKELMKISREGIKGRGPLSLSLKAMKTIRDHFRKLKRKPTDVELESLAQTWSEHCKHTIFADPLDEVKEGIYRRYIKGATEKIRKQKGKKDFCVSVFKDNSGAIAFDDEYLITHKVETHNSPSALDPFGGSVTAIVGVNRDCLGFGQGAKPIANTYGFCVADPNDSMELFRDKSKKQPLLTARRILEGVVRGINIGGNQSGIPTPLGFVAVDPSFRGKPLVFGGTVGLIPRSRTSSLRGKPRNLYEKRAMPGDYIVMVGGRVGLDGIHGATFSSESLASGSPATAVQIGDPITQKKLSDALIREARSQGLHSSITDDGAGGLSGSVGEMAKESGGCEVELEKVPLKYPGLAPWQIWLSESQERMTLAVPKKNWVALKKIFDRHDVEATRIGEFTRSGHCIVRHNRKTVMDVSLDFLHEGRPIRVQKSKKTASRKQKAEGRADTNIGKVILDVLARPNIGSISFISQQYDHEVQGSSVTKPLQGRGRVNVDAAVIKPIFDSERGVVLAQGYAPWYSELDTYAMAAAAIDTVVRNAIAAGASRDYLAILDNFCWSSSEKPERLYELKRAAKACYDVATAYGTPFISGKDSMFNDFRGFDAKGRAVHIAALPTLLISAIGVIPNVAKAMTLDFKQADDRVFVIGAPPKHELGGSEYYSMRGIQGGSVPAVDTAENSRTYDALSRAIDAGAVASATSVSRGGLGIALAKSCIAGQVGATLNINAPTEGEIERILLSESQGRFVVTIPRNKKDSFEKILRASDCSFVEFGQVADGPLTINMPRGKLELGLKEMTDAYRSFFKNW